MLLAIAVASAAGYVARRKGWLDERWATRLMTLVVALGYSSIALLSIWKLDLKVQLLWLPLLLGVQIVLMTGIALVAGRPLARDRQELGMFGVANALGNLSFTMGGLVAYILYGQVGLGLVAVCALCWDPLVVLFIYPVARHYSGQQGLSLGRLMARSVFDFRSLGLPMMITGLILSGFNVPRPGWIDASGIVDILMLAVIVLAYFAIGLRLRFRHVESLWRLAVLQAGIRFGVGIAMGLGLLGLTLLTPWPLTGPQRGVFLIETFVPMAVTSVAVANMFGLRPEESSVLFVVNTLAYILFILPLVLVFMG